MAFEEKVVSLREFLLKSFVKECNKSEERRIKMARNEKYSGQTMLEENAISFSLSDALIPFL